MPAVVVAQPDTTSVRAAATCKSRNAPMRLGAPTARGRRRTPRAELTRAVSAFGTGGNLTATAALDSLDVIMAMALGVGCNGA